MCPAPGAALERSDNMANCLSAPLHQRHAFAGDSSAATRPTTHAPGAALERSDNVAIPPPSSSPLVHRYSGQYQPEVYPPAITGWKPALVRIAAT